MFPTKIWLSQIIKLNWVVHLLQQLHVLIVNFLVSSGDEEATFGNTLVEAIVIGKTHSTIGNVSINLNKVIENSVNIGITSTNNGQSYQKVDISNLYIDRQKLICNDIILFSTSGT